MLKLKYLLAKIGAHTPENTGQHYLFWPRARHAGLEQRLAAVRGRGEHGLRGREQHGVVT